MRTLLVGFDSAWSSRRSGAFVGVLREQEGRYRELGPPRPATFEEVETAILEWQGMYAPEATVVMIDQPTIVENEEGQRLVEKLVASPVGRRYGGVQPANRGKSALFGNEAPIWRFLNRFGGPADPLGQPDGTWVIETYPVLAIISLGWTLPNDRLTGRLPKYNPTRRKTFSSSDWKHVCRLASRAFCNRRLSGAAEWLDSVAVDCRTPKKCDQDCLDACICLLVALHLVETGRCLLVGNTDTGYMVVPHECGLSRELTERCETSGQTPSDLVRSFCLPPTFRPGAQDGTTAGS